MRSEALYLYGHIASAAFPNEAVSMFVIQTPNVPALLGPNNTNFYRCGRLSLFFFFGGGGGGGGQWGR